MSVKERPIIFSSESVRQILAGRKTMTRRVLRQPKRRDGAQLLPELLQDIGVGHACPYGAVGERLWAREKWKVATGLRQGDLTAVIQYGDGSDYRSVTMPADKPLELGLALAGSDWRSPLFMPRWASRLTLELTEVRVERLNSISHEDAIAEGEPDVDPGGDIINGSYAVGQYKRTWQKLNAKRGFPWESNPWVWVLSFKLLSPERS